MRNRRRFLNSSSYPGAHKTLSFLTSMTEESAPSLLNLRLERENRIYNSSGARDKYAKKNIQKKVSQHIKVVRGIVSEPLHCVVI